METLPIIITVTALAAFTSLCGGFLLLTGSNLSKTIKKVGPFLSLGIMLYTTLVVMVPLISDIIPLWQLLILGLSSILMFFMFGRLIGRYREHGGLKRFKNTGQTTLAVLVDTARTLINGAVIGFSFYAGVGVGIAVTAAIVAHELSQEIDDFALMLKSKTEKPRIVLVQVVSTIVLIPAAVVAFYFSDSLIPQMPYLFTIIAGFMLSIALNEALFLLEQSRKR